MNIKIAIIADGTEIGTLDFSEETLVDLIWVARTNRGENLASEATATLGVEDVLAHPKQQWLNSGLNYREQRKAACDAFLRSKVYAGMTEAEIIAAREQANAAIARFLRLEGDAPVPVDPPAEPPSEP